MSWFNSNYQFRIPISVDFSTITSGVPVLKDVQVDVPDDYDLFWTTIRSDFRDVVPCFPDGNVVPFKRSVANYSGRQLQLQMDNVSCPKTRCTVQLFLYYGFATESVDRATTPTITTPSTGHIYLGAPTGRTVVATTRQPNTQEPLAQFQKATTEVIDIWFSLKTLLSNRVESYNERDLFEEVNTVKIQSLDAAGANDDARFEQTNVRFINGWVRARVKAGSSGTNYAVSAQIETDQNQLFDVRCLLKVIDLLPQ